jgi:uncharacterized protein
MRLLLYLFLLAAAALLWSLIEAQLFIVKKIRFKNTKGDSSAKIVFISDLHYGTYYRRNRLAKIIDRINSLRPDIIILGGDYLDFGRNSKLNKLLLDKLFYELSRLKINTGVLTVLGNHDYYLKDKMHFLIDKIKENKILVLKNESFKLQNKNICIHGVDDFLEGSVNIDQLNVDDKLLNVFVSHNPDFFENCKHKPDIGLSGHTHGGQITVFGLYAPVTESRYGQKYVKTVNVKDNSIVVTTNGIGCTFLPLRFFAIPQIIELTIQ